MAVSGVEQGKTPESLVTPAFTGFIPIAESGTKAALTTGMTTDRKNFIFTVRRGIMAQIEYPGIAKLVSRLVWDQETVRSSRTTRTKIPLKSTISEGFFLFFVYCGAYGEMDTHTLRETSCIVQHSNRFSIHLYKYNSVEFVVEWEYNIY